MPYILFSRKPFTQGPYPEFDINVWNLHLKKYISILEHVQRRARKRPHATNHLQYESRKAMFIITTIFDRPLREDLIQKIQLYYNLDEINTTPPTDQGAEAALSEN